MVWQLVQVRGIVSCAYGIKIAMPNQSFFAPASRFQLIISSVAFIYLKHSFYCIFYLIISSLRLPPFCIPILYAYPVNFSDKNAPYLLIYIYIYVYFFF